MSRYRGPVCRFCRREGMKLFLKGERCLTDKCSFDRKNYAPGVHGQRRTKLSEFGMQLREKQKVRRVYGVIEKQLRGVFDRASKKRGVTSEAFFQLLELRLDNVVYRMGFASSRSEARQFVRHNHVLVNGKRCNIPSAGMKVGDMIQVAEKSHKIEKLKGNADHFAKRPPLPWVDVDHTRYAGKVIAMPQREDIQLAVKERLIVELYSK